MGVCRKSLTQEVEGTSLAVFRMVYGAVGVASMVRLVAYGWVGSLYTGPERHLTYPGLRFVDDLGPTGTHGLVATVAVAALAVALGFHARMALAVFVAGFGWLEFVDVATYLNHYWFMTVTGLVLLGAPMDTTLALRPSRRPVPMGWVWLVRALVAMVYIFAGLAKLNADWLLHGLPLRMWLPTRSSLPLIGPVLEAPATAYALSWLGAIYDCTIVALLCLRRTRRYAWAAVVAFHVSTWILFPIGVFPWLMIGASTIFFEPDWPRRVARRLPHRLPGRAALTAPGSNPGGSAPLDARWWVAAGFTAVLFVVPFRAAIVPGDARWTTEGYRFSWNVLRVERAGDVRFRVVDLASGAVTVDTAGQLYTPLQWKLMATEPELVRQAAHAIRDEREAEGLDVAVYADVFVSLNGRPAARLVAPDVDLSREPYRSLGQPWILPAPGGPTP